MEYNALSNIQNLEDFLRTSFHGPNKRYIRNEAVDYEELWNCSLFLAKVLYAAKPVSNLTTEEGFLEFVSDYETKHSVNINLDEMFGRFFLRKVGGHIFIAGQIDYSCLQFDEIIDYKPELEFLAVQQASDRQNDMDTLKFDKTEFEDRVCAFESQNNVTLDRNGIYFKKWFADEGTIFRFSNIEAYFQFFLDSWDDFLFINTYRKAKQKIEDKSFLFIEAAELKKIYKSHKQLYPEMPGLNELTDGSQFARHKNDFRIRFHGSSDNYWNLLSNEISGRYWTLLERDVLRGDKQENLLEWLFKTKHLDAYNPLLKATINAQWSFCDEVYLFLKMVPDLAGGKDEIKKMMYDGGWSSKFSKARINFLDLEIKEKSPQGIYRRLTDRALANDNTLYDQRSRTGVNKLITAFICYERKIIPKFDEDGDALPQKSYVRIVELLLLSRERPYLTWKICEVILQSRQEILPSLFAHPSLVGLGVALTEKMKAHHPGDRLNYQLWKQSTELFLSCAREFSFRAKEVAMGIFELFAELNKEKYPDFRGSQKSMDPGLISERSKREERITAMLFQATLNTKDGIFIHQVFKFLCFYFKTFKTAPPFKNRVIRFPMLQWDGIFRLLQVMTSAGYTKHLPDLGKQVRSLTGIFLESYLQLLETDEAVGFDFKTKKEKLGKINWSESIERLDKLQWLYLVYHLHKFDKLGRFLNPGISFEPAEDIYDEKNRLHILQLRTHIGVLLQLLKQLISPEIPYGFEKAKLSEIRSMIEDRVIAYVKQHSVNEPKIGRFDIFDFNQGGVLVWIQ